MAYQSPLFPLSSFEGIRQPEHRGFGEMPGQNLHSYRQALGGHSARYAHARNARQTAGNCIDVRKVHGDWVVYFFAQPESRERRNRRHNRIHLLKSVRKITGDERPHFLSLQVIRLIVSRTEHVSAQHDAPLTLGSEALAACVPVHIGKRVAMFRAESVAYAIVSRSEER